MRCTFACLLILFTLGYIARGDERVLITAIENARKQEQFQLADGKTITYAITDKRNGIVVQRVEGFMVFQNGEALHRRVEDRMRSSPSSLVANLSTKKFQAELRCELRPKSALPKADSDMAGYRFAVRDYTENYQFHSGGISHFAPAMASIIPKYSLTENFRRWQDSGNKALYTSPNDSGVKDSQYHKFVLTNWPQEDVPELTLWIDERMRIIKRASKEEKFGFGDVASLVESETIDGLEFPLHFVVERTRFGSNPKSFRTEVKATLKEITSPVPSEWFTLEHYGVSPRVQPQFAKPPSNIWRVLIAGILLFACVVAIYLFFRQREH